MQSHLSIAVQLQHFWHLGEGYVQGCHSPSLWFELLRCRGGLPAWRGQGESSECFLGLYDMLSREASPASLADEALASRFVPGEASGDLFRDSYCSV